MKGEGWWGSESLGLQWDLLHLSAEPRLSYCGRGGDCFQRSDSPLGVAEHHLSGQAGNSSCLVLRAGMCGDGEEMGEVVSNEGSSPCWVCIPG